MANFDLDDPLGDLLSEGSNDSFFEEPKTLAKRSSLTKTPEKKAVSDLFGLTSQEAKPKEKDWLGLGDDTPAPVTQKPPPSKPIKKISFDDDDDNDLFSSLGIDKKQSDDKRSAKSEGKKSSLMESIFGPSSNTKVEEKTTLDDILKESKVSRQEAASSIKQPDLSAKQEVEKKEPAVKYGLSSLDAPREGRRGLKTSQSNLMDPLGLFTNTDTKKPESPSRKREILPSKTPPEATVNVSFSKEPVQKTETEVLFNSDRDMKTKSAPNLTDLPDWLGTNTKASTIRPHKSDVGINNVGVTSAPPPAPSNISNVGGESSISLPQTEPTSFVPVGEVTSNQTLDSLIAQQKMATTHLGYQNTALALQQQETQLVLALQLRKYEENLAEMQKQQHEILLKQEQQFNNLLERQFTKQQLMENNMKLQQERINSHIQLLLSQPPVGGVTADDGGTKVSELRKTNSEEIIQLYEQMISSLKQHHHEELFLLEETYKKQISTLEAGSEAIENRLKTELDYLEKKHRENLDSLKAEYEQNIEKLKKQIEELQEQHALEIRKIKDNQNALVEDVRQEYSTMLDNIKQAKTNESNFLEHASTYSEKLEISMKMLDVNSKALLNLKDKVDSDQNVLTKAREESLKAREEEIKMMREALQKARDMAETERSQLMGLVRTLEMKLAEQNQNAREERWALQQATATFTAKAAALDREVEYTRATLEQERAQIKTMKENLLAEQERITLQLTEEKLALTAEKTRLQTLEKLQSNFDNQKSKVEVDAAIQAAQQAAEEAYKEKEVFQQQQLELETIKRKLEERERRVNSREINLEQLVKEAERKYLEGERALRDAKNMENTYSTQLRDIQRQLTSLASREKRLAEEKISLSKERLAVNNAARMSKKCSLCSVDVPSKLNEEEEIRLINEEYEPSMPNFQVDPELLRLRMEIANDSIISPKNP